MTGLTQVAITARKIIRYTLFFIVFLTIGRILWGVGVTLYLQIFPPAPAAPNPKFGILTKIPFPENLTLPNLTYTAQTANGGLPTNIPDQAKVFLMPKVNPNLLSLDNAKSKAQAMGFNDPDPEAISDVIYKFKNQKYPTSLIMNIVTGAFSLSYDLIADRTPLLNRPPASEVAAAKFKDILNSAQILPNDLTGPTIPDYLKLDSGKLVKVIALSEADVTKVNLFRKEYDKLPSLTSSPTQANVWGMVSGAQQNQQQIIAAEYHYFPVDETQYGTYQIKTPQQAFTELQNGKAFVANIGRYKDGDSVTVRKIYLAYYDPDVAGDFYQPIFVFDSDDSDPANSFIGYIPAVTAEYYQN